MLLAVTAFFAACSDDDASWNTNADVTVEMGKTEVKVKEGAFSMCLSLSKVRLQLPCVYMCQ